jgi:hypothetical protein
MFKNIISAMVLLLHLAVVACAQDARQPDKAALEAWQGSIKDLTTREKEIYAALKNANEVQEEKLELELKTLAEKKIQRKAAYIAANPSSSFFLWVIMKMGICFSASSTIKTNRVLPERKSKKSWLF